uniref:Dynactin subunit 4 n=1 Tax=Syphacia muris TaxID=451379 RepID=A0A0N5B069_9BILA
MATLLSIDEVVYECSCGEWCSLNRLFFCRHCSGLRCTYCVSVEMDSMYCPMCLDSVSTGEARMKKNRCLNCFHCPICGKLLLISLYHKFLIFMCLLSQQSLISWVYTYCKVIYKTIVCVYLGVGVSVKFSNDVYTFVCATCRWSTTLTALPGDSWPESCKEDEKKLETFLENMQNIATAEKIDRERYRYTKRRSNLGGVFSDRFGLQLIYNRRKAALMGLANENKVESLETTDDVPQLNPEIFSNTVIDISSVPKLEQQIKQPLLLLNSLNPIKTSLLGRKGIRCKQCDHSLCKSEYNPSSVKFKIQVLATQYVPDVRISRPPKVTIGQWSNIYLTVLNFSASTMQLTLTPENCTDGNFVKVIAIFYNLKFFCEEFSIDLPVPNRDETVEMDEAIQTISDLKHDAVFRRRHQVDFAVKVLAETKKQRTLGLIISYTSLSSIPEPKSENVALKHRIHINLGIPIE